MGFDFWVQDFYVIVTVQVLDRDANETIAETFFEEDLPTPVHGGQPYYS